MLLGWSHDSSHDVSHNVRTYDATMRRREGPTVQLFSDLILLFWRSLAVLLTWRLGGSVAHLSRNRQDVKEILSLCATMGIFLIDLVSPFYYGRCHHVPTQIFRQQKVRPKITYLKF